MHSYKAKSVAHCKELYKESVERTLHFARIAEEMDLKPKVVSIGSTPPFMFKFDIPEGVTEIRPGTYILLITVVSTEAAQRSYVPITFACEASIKM